MQYYLIIAFQAFCVYHLFKNRNNYYWIFAIVFLPVVGCLIYLLTEVFKNRDKEKLEESLTTIINPSKKIKDLERKLQFSETYQNRVNLADAYFSAEDYSNAIVHYNEALQDSSQNEFYVKKSLIKLYFQQEDYDAVVNMCESLKHQSEFKKSELPYFFGVSLDKIGKVDEAETQLRIIDQPFSNYDERLELIKFLISKNKNQEANDVLDEVYSEIQLMTKNNRRIYRQTIDEIEKMKNIK